MSLPPRSLSCFKAYDIRGHVPEELNEDLARDIGVAFVAEIGAKTVVTGRDVRLESPALQAALNRGLVEAGAEVVDIGLCGTEEIYFNTFHRGVDGGIMITASHNPKGTNGMKMVRAGSRPVSGDSGLFGTRDRVLARDLPVAATPGRVVVDTDKTAYIDHLLTHIDVSALRPLTIVADPGNGGAGPAARLLEKRLPFHFVFVNEEPNGEFPNGVPNPLLPENRAATSRAVIAAGADFGIAWDGDFDRCFLFDDRGEFIEGYYLVALLAETALAAHPGEAIIHDPRLTWNTVERVRAAGGRPVQSKTGHAFIKEAMRRENAIYGGEMSAHHYFRDFAHCDSGMIPWLMIAELVSRRGRSLRELVADAMRAHPCSGEINYKVADAKTVVARVVERFEAEAIRRDDIDGVGLEFADWRFNLRSSNTEPLLRLNVESRGDADLVARRVAEIEAIIKTPG